jgi:phage shock protein E
MYGGKDMNKTILIGMVMVLVIGGVLIATGSEGGQQNTTEQPKVSMQQVRGDVDGGGTLLDVRTPEEFSASHIDGATNLSLQSIQAGSLPDVAKDKPVYLYCRSGSRSAQAAAVLKAAGYSNVIDLGAMSDVQALGGAVKS